MAVRAELALDNVPITWYDDHTVEGRAICTYEGTYGEKEEEEVD